MSGPIPPEERAQMLKEYEQERQRDLQSKMDNAQYSQPSDHSTMGDLGRGAMQGLATSGNKTLATVGKLISYFGGQNVGGTLQKYADDNTHESMDYWDPRGTAGRIGEGAGELAGTGAQVMAASAPLGGARLAGAAAKTPLIGGAGTAAMGAALPGAVVHGAVNSMVGDPGDPGFWGTVGRDELGAGILGGAFGAARGAGRLLGKVGGKLAGQAGEAFEGVTGQQSPWETASDKADKVAEYARQGFNPDGTNAATGHNPWDDVSVAGNPPAASQPGYKPPGKAVQAAAPAAPTRPSPAEMIPSKPLPADEANLGPASKDNLLTADEEKQVQAFRDRLAAAREPLRTSAASGDRPTAVAAANESKEAREGIDKVIKGARVRGKPAVAEAPKTTDVQADAEVSKPAQSAKKGSQKGGVAKATPVESNSGNGAQGSPTASKSAPATKPAASETSAATPEKVTRKLARAQTKGKVEATPMKGGLTAAESTQESDNDSYLKTTRELVKGLSDGPGKQKMLATIAKVEAEQAAFAAKRGGK